jgi:hypothetical protein
MRLKRILKALFFFSLALCFSVPCAASYKQIKVTLDGKELNFTSQPFIYNSRTMVQMRPIFESLSFKINWDDSTKTVTAKKDGLKIKLTADSNKAYINGEKINMDTRPVIKNDYVYVPLRFIAESTGCNVNWDSGTYTAAITSSKTDTYIPDGDVTDSDSVVMINTDKIQGSGIILSSDGYIATNFHVIENASTVNIIFNNKTVYTGNVFLAAYDTARDIAIIKIDYSGLYPAFISRDKVSANDNVFTIGSSDGHLNTFSQGQIKEVSDYMISTTAVFSKGNSGGALFDSNGKLIGITSCYDNKGNYMAIPINFVTSLDIENLIPLSEWKNIKLSDETPKFFSVSKNLNKIYLSWAPVYGAEGYKVYYSFEKDGDYNILKSSNSTELFPWSFPNCTELSVSGNGNIYFKVSAIINGVESPKSNTEGI